MTFFSILFAAVMVGVGWVLLATSLRPRPLSRAAIRFKTAARAARGSGKQFYDPKAEGNTSSFPTIFEAASVYLSVIVPAYNEEARLGHMLEEALQYLERRATDTTGYSPERFTYEVIIVDDGSKDGTVRLARQFTDRYGGDKVRVLVLPQNSGKGAAVKQGMLVARGKLLLMADADGATRFADMEYLERKLHEIADWEHELGAIIVGSRYVPRAGLSRTDREHPIELAVKPSKTMASKTGESESSTTSAAAARQETVASQVLRDWRRKLLGKGFNWMVKYLGGVRDIRDTQCGFKMFARDSARTLFLTQHLTRWAFDVELLYLAQRLGVPIAEVGVNWTEIPGSKLRVVRAIVNMALDILKMRTRYFLGVWRIEHA
jgi:dolichyl-phosphate beta-glucosyltransferase